MWPLNVMKDMFIVTTDLPTQLAIIVSTNSSYWVAFSIGSVSSRECLDAPAILATFTAGRTGSVIV